MGSLCFRRCLTDQSWAIQASAAFIVELVPGAEAPVSCCPEVSGLKPGPISEAKATDLSQAKATDLSQAKATDLSQAKAIDLSQAKAIDLAQRQGRSQKRFV